MPRSTSSDTLSGAWQALQVPDAWRQGLLRLALGWTALVLLFLPDWAAMARQWWDSSTYNHILLIPPILGWLVWQRSGELLKLEPRPWWPGLVSVAGAAFFWLLGAFSGLDLARQIGAVAVLGLSVPVLLGPRVAWGLIFPLCYMMALVPFGDELIGPLQMITAAITIALVELSGIQATIDGVFIDTPAGLFEVAEACSGVKFLIAMVAFGLLVANVCFVSWPRRALFLAACIVVPILANGVRAWGTVYAAQFFGVEAAAGFDHIVYGWIFFAAVLALVLSGAWRFFDRPVDDPVINAEAIAASVPLGRLEKLSIGVVPALILLLAIPLGAQIWARAASGLAAELPDTIALPEVPGWEPVEFEPRFPWQPRASGAGRRLLVSYRDEQGRRVELFLALYARQGEDADAGGFGEGALPPESGWDWQSPGPAMANAKSERLLAAGEIERLAVTRYRSGGQTTGSNLRLKLAAMADRLLLRARPTVTLILSAEEKGGRPAADALADFEKAFGSLDAWMDRAAGME